MTRLQRALIADDTWWIAGTHILVHHYAKGRWYLYAETGRDETLRWTREQDLEGAEHRTRRDLLRSYEAAASIAPPPPADRLALRRLAAGRYQVPGTPIVIIRETFMYRRIWRIINAPANDRPRTATLGQAAEQVRALLYRNPGWMAEIAET